MNRDSSANHRLVPRLLRLLPLCDTSTCPTVPNVNFGRQSYWNMHTRLHALSGTGRLGALMADPLKKNYRYILLQQESAASGDAHGL